MGVVIPVLPKLIEGFMDGAHADAVRIGGMLGLVWALMQFLSCCRFKARCPIASGAAPCLLAVDDGPRAGLYLDGAGAEPDLALHRARHFGRDGGELQHRQCLHRRRHAAGKAPRRVRSDGSGLRHRLRHRSGARRLCRQLRSAPAVLGRGRIEPAERALRLFHSAGIVAARTPQQEIFLRQRPLLGFAAHARPQTFSWRDWRQRIFSTWSRTTFIPPCSSGSRCTATDGTKPRTVWLLPQPASPASSSKAASSDRWSNGLGPRRSMAAGLMFGITGFLDLCRRPNRMSVWIAIPIAALWGFYTPAAQSIMTQRVGPSQQGQLQGALGSMMGLAAIVSPPLYTNVFALAIEAKDRSPGAADSRCAVFRRRVPVDVRPRRRNVRDAPAGKRRNRRLNSPVMQAHSCGLPANPKSSRVSPSRCGARPRRRRLGRTGSKP